MSKATNGIAALRKDYDALVNVLKARDAQISILEQGRDSINNFLHQTLIPAFNRVSASVEWQHALLSACIAPDGIRAMGTIHKKVMAKAKREADKRARAAKAAADAAAKAAAPRRGTTAKRRTG